ncbi:Chromatin modification-related protein YNG2 [Zalerion maritima]|uniref:Chromatin modification-related protein n=1 Tax=Zalerion maritima TaxID=339359 RepID=A0AAD5WPB6_9PEZI|nr:Chromatin modification-related protein YNG2 [Zalerion maritima]
MPRDDLSIDMTKNMRLPIAEGMDSAAVLEDFILRASNIPGEASFAFTELEAKDKEIAECKAAAEEADNKLQRFIKTHGSHHLNPREKQLSATAREKYERAKLLSAEKIVLLDTLIRNFDKHVRTFDVQLNALTERNEPGFEDPDELPSLIRNSAANATSQQPSLASPRPNGSTSSSLPTAGPSSAPAAHALQVLNQAINRSGVNHNSQIRLAQSQHNYASSAPATPAASMIMGRYQRESSAGPAVGSVPKRAPRQNSGLTASIPANPSALGRQTSMGPGITKGTPTLTISTSNLQQSVSQPGRAGSVGPKSASAAGSKGTSSRKGTPSSTARKRPPPNKSNLSRQKRPKKSPGSDPESELSDAESGSMEDEDATSRETPKPRGGDGGDGGGGGGPGVSGGVGGGMSAGTTGPHGHHGHHGPALTRRDGDGDVEMDDEEASDDKKYCLCQHVSFGDMVACDNDDCPYEWFHWSCVGLKSEPTGRWYCPVCRESKGGGQKKK